MRIQCLLIATCLLLAGCGACRVGPADTFGLDLTPSSQADTQSAIVFIVDGVNATIFQEMLEAGELPNIRKHFVERGIYAPRAIANTPSVTMANLTSIATGVWPGHHGITGINWFDRETRVWRNYNTIAQKNTLDGDHDAPLLYQYFPDDFTVSVFYQPHRGASKFFENWTSAGPPYFFGWYEFVDRLTLYRFGEMMELARQRGEHPRIVMAYLLAPDFRAYEQGVSSKAYRDAIRHADTQIGRLLADMQAAGTYEQTTLALLSDHSLGDVHAHLVLDDYLQTLGFDLPGRNLWEKTTEENRVAYYSRFRMVTYGSGDRYWAIQIRKPRADGSLADWSQRPSPANLSAYPNDRGETVDLLARLIEPEAVEAIAWKTGQSRCRVRTKKGEIEFAQGDGHAGPVTATLIAGDDFLAGLADGKARTTEQWLRATTGGPFPDLPPQIVAYFRGRRAADIACFAASGFDFVGINRAGHGGLRGYDEMHVPLLIAGDGITPRAEPFARTVDLLATLLDRFGLQRPAHLDGRSLLSGRAEK